MRILVIENDSYITESLHKGLRSHGHAIDLASQGEKGLDLTEINDYDLVILDLDLHDIDGHTVCCRLRASLDSVGIIILTKRFGISDRIKGLDAGADDYICKPCNPDEFMARVRAVLRRKGVARHAVLQNGDLLLDPNTMKAFFKDADIGFSVKEFCLIEHLVRNQDRVVTSEELLEHIWGEEADAFSTIVKVCVTRARRKMQTAGCSDLITTVKGKGYLVSSSLPPHATTLR
jgi:DNA-binding response OmpR family regulator